MSASFATEHARPETVVWLITNSCVLGENAAPAASAVIDSRAIVREHFLVCIMALWYNADDGIVLLQVELESAFPQVVRLPRFNCARACPKSADVMRPRPLPRKHVTGTSRPRMVDATRVSRAGYTHAARRRFATHETGAIERVLPLSP